MPEFSSNGLIWLAVDINVLRTIQDLKVLIAKKININNTANLNLYCKDCFLPDDETILIIRDEDLIQVQSENRTMCISNKDKAKNYHSILYNSKHQTKKPKKRKSSNSSDTIDKSHSMNIIEVNEDRIETLSNKSIKYHSKKKKKKEKHKDDSDEVIVPSNEIIVSSKHKDDSNKIDMLTSHKENHEGKYLLESVSMIISDEHQADNTINTINSAHEEENLVDSNNKMIEQENKIHKKKRRRRHKKSNKMCNLSDIAAQNNINESNNEISKINNHSNLISDSSFNPENKHIRFDENDKNSTCMNFPITEKKVRDFQTKSDLCPENNILCNSSSNAHDTDVKFRNNLFSYGDSLKIEKLKNLENPNSVYHYKEISKEKQLSTVNTNISFLFTNRTEEKNLKSEISSVELKDYHKYPLLRGPPRVGDVIAFKVLELSSSYCPELSNYKEGRVLEHNQGTDDFLIEYLTPIETRLKGKFDLPEEDNNQFLNEEQRNNVVNWSAMREARLITS